MDFEGDFMSPEVSNALNTVNRLIPLVDEAERQFKGARNWGFLDVLGKDSLVVDLVKHYKLNKAKNVMDDVNYLLQELSRQLGGINIPENYRMELGGFLTFADFVFDGVLVDVYMMSKIMNSIDQIRTLKSRLYTVKSRLEQMR